MYLGNRYKCGFCSKEVRDQPISTLCLCTGMSGYDIANICEDCLNNIKRRVVFTDNGK